jgi:hypothetical protein
MTGYYYRLEFLGVALSVSYNSRGVFAFQLGSPCCHNGGRNSRGGAVFCNGNGLLRLVGR